MNNKHYTLSTTYTNKRTKRTFKEDYTVTIAMFDVLPTAPSEFELIREERLERDQCVTCGMQTHNMAKQVLVGVLSLFQHK
jgi:hypothetical protein